MLARIAQELYWLGRDLTRAEFTARILDGAFHADVAGAPSQRGVALSWEGVLATIGAKPPAPGSEETEIPAYVALGRIEVARMLTLDTDSPASVVSCVARARERARTMRDVISTEMWEAVNSFYLMLGRYDLHAALQTGPYSFYQDVKERCGLFWGVVDRTLLRDEGRAFLEAGGHIEQADMILRMLRVATPAGVLDADGHETEAIAMLHAVGGVQAYRRAMTRAPAVRPVVRFLLYDSAYPGSVAASVEALAAALTVADAQPRSSSPVLRIGRLVADLELRRRTVEVRSEAQAVLQQVQDELTLVDHEVDARYFAVATLSAVLH